MASMNLPVPPSGALDRPPPSPLNPTTPGDTQAFGGTQIPGLTPGGPPDAMKQATQMGMEIDRALLAFAELAPGDLPEIGQARKLLQAALAKILQAQGEPMAAAGSTGTQFPGGGMVAGAPF